MAHPGDPSITRIGLSANEALRQAGPRAGAGEMSDRPLDPAQQYQDQDDQEDQADPAGRIVAPASAVGPSRQSADQEQNQDDEQYRSERHHVLPRPARPR